VIFPDFVIPKISQIHLKPETHPHTLAIIRPDALEHYKGRCRLTSRATRWCNCD